MSTLDQSINGLTLEQRAILELRLKKKREQTPRVPSIPRRNQESASPLSFAQQRLWFLDQLEPGGASYNGAAMLRLRGALDIGALERALGEIVRRHEILRTSFPAVDALPMQVIAPPQALRLPLRDLSALSSDESEAAVQRAASEEVERPFDLASGPLMRCSLLRLDHDEHVLLLAMHHIIGDGWSIAVFIRELAPLYETYSAGRPSPLAELPIQYADYASWQREWLQGEALEQLSAYWKQKFAIPPPVLGLPTDRPSPCIQSFRGAKVAFNLDAELSEGLRALSRREGSTLFMTLLAALQILLYRYTGQTDVSVGSPVAGRVRAETENLIGLFVNMLVLRTNLDGQQTFREVLARVRETALDAFAHQDLPFEKLVEEVQPQRDLSRNPLFQVMFALHNLPQANLKLAGLRLNLKQIDSKAAKFDLYLSINDVESLNGALEYNTDLFDESTIKRLRAHWQTLLTHLVSDDADQPVSQLPLMSAQERAQILVQWNETGREYGTELCVHELFERQAEKRPDDVALVYEEECVSYGELNCWANRLAHQLRSLGVNCESLVGIFMQRSVEMIVSLLAVLKAGGAYVPLDPDFPAERLSMMLEDAGAGLLLTQRRLLESLPRHCAHVLCVDAEEKENSEFPETNPVNEACAESLAYVIYTSGSTGRPKGVQISHRSVHNFLTAMSSEPGLTSDDVLLAVTTLSFDIAGLEIFLPLANGARVVLASREVASDGALLRRQLSDCGATVMQATPATWRNLLQAGWQGAETLKILCGGEALSGELAGELLTRGASLWNLYGPTETTIWSAARRVEEASRGTVNIGQPIWNVEIYLLDQHLQPVPVGVPARLFIGGHGLARGYLQQPHLTAQRFIPHPFSSSPGARLYDTGDLARFLPSGDIEYLGRSDHQVKLRGYRIELGELETVLSQHPALTEVVALVREVRRENGGEGVGDEKHVDEKQGAATQGEKQLVAYLVLGEGEPEPSIAELRAHVGRELPEYMIPSVFVVMERMPLTPNGKVDRRALAEMAASSSSSSLGSGGESKEKVFARTETEEVVSGIWGAVLGRERVGVEENFFELGGHSLLATQVVSRVREAFGVEMPLRRLFEAPTVSGLAQRIDDEMRAGAKLQLPPLKRVSPQTDLPLSYAQQRLWFLDQLEPDNPFYNMAAAIRLSGHLQITVLTRAINEIVRRHDVLRTVFTSQDGKPLQVILPLLDLTVPLTDLSALSPDEREAQVQSLARVEMQRPFNLSSGPLLRASVLRLKEDEHVALLTIHHIISDGWSIAVFIRELAPLYETYSAGRPSPLAELPIQYADYASWQREWLQGEALKIQMDYWLAQLSSAPGMLELPTDRTRPAIQSFRGARQISLMPSELSDALRAFCRRGNVTPFMCLLAAYNILLSRYSRQEEIVVGTPIAGRTRGETEDLIGFFANTLALRTSLGGNPTFKEMLARTREMCLGAYAHQDLPFEKLVEELQPERSLSHQPLFQVMFALQNAHLNKLTMSDLRVSPLEIDGGVARFDLLLNVMETEQGLTGVFEYNTDLFDESTIKRLRAHWQTLLTHLVSDDADQPVSQLPLMSAQERAQILVQWNETGREYGTELCVHELFERQAEKRPDDVALVYEEECVSYGELNCWANRLAHQLRRSGIGPDSLVGICTERSVEMVLGVLAILKAGGAYVPLDPQYPRARLAAMVEDASVTVLLTQQRLLHLLPEHSAPVIFLDQWRETSTNDVGANDADTQNIRSGVSALNLAYVIYTSGSTGRPKGVALPHRALTNLIEWHLSELLPEARTLQFASLSFDASFHEMFAAWHTGGTLFVINEELRRDVHALSKYLVEQRIEKVILPVVVLQQLAEEFARVADTGLSLKEITTTGEQLQITTPVIELFRKFDETAFHNHYGPSETHVVTAYTMPEDISTWKRYPPIGQPIWNVEIYLLDQHLQPVPVGVPARLFIGGHGLARGYLQQPHLTAQRFIPHPFSSSPGARLYDTGDLARFLPSGDIEYLGRSDHQVKLRGYRIELGELETVLSQHPALTEVVALVREVRRENGGEGVGDEKHVDEKQGAATQGEKQLVAYLVLGEGEPEPSIAELRAHVGRELPEYMIPSVFVVMERMPLTPNGKVDRRALAEMAASSSSSSLGSGGESKEKVFARTETEEVVSGIWGAVLGRERVGVEENFFELGGHSLLATQVVSRVREAFGVEMPLRRLFEAPTIEGMVNALVQIWGDREQVEEIARTLRYVEQLSADEVRNALSNQQ